MKNYIRIIAIAALVSGATLLSGCDQIRKLAGRPTSSDISALRLVIEETEEKEAARQDSIRVAVEMSRKEKEDSIAAFEGFSQVGAYLRKPSDLRGIRSGNLDHRYYIAVGAFKQPANAQRQMAKYDEQTYSPCSVLTGAGLNVVLVCPCDKAADIYRAFRELMGTKLFPKDAWILVADDNWNLR